MIDYTQIHQSLIPRVGFRPTFNKKTYNRINTDLQISDSSLLFNAVSEKYLTSENMSLLLEYAEGMDVDVWDNTATYSIGDNVLKVVNNVRQVYVSLTDSNTGNDPETDQANWDSYLSHRLRQYKESACSELISKISNIRNIKTYTTRLLENAHLFFSDSVGETDTQKQDRLTGLMIRQSRTENKAITISKIGVKFDTAQTVRFFLYHSDRLTPLQEFDIVIDPNEANTFVWKELIDINGNPLVIKSISNDYNSGGRFFLKFDEANIVGNYVSWEHLGLSTGGVFNNLYSSGFSFSVGHFNATDYTDKPNIPRIGEYFDNYQYEDEVPFNIRFSVEEDLTSHILDNISLFDEAYQGSVAIKIMTDFLHSDRISNVSNNAQSRLYDLLYGQKGTENKGLIMMQSFKVKRLLKDLGVIMPDKKGAYQGAI